eukprot:154593-Lingulodinium_polyedra.AAC.1
MVIIDQGHGYHDGCLMVTPCVLHEVRPDHCFVGVGLDDQRIDAMRPPERMQTCCAHPLPVLPHFCQ